MGVYISLIMKNELYEIKRLNVGYDRLSLAVLV